ncbi:MAG: GDP-mannose 4,6-dehydratase [Candidatus Omnitrophota bacterium]
MKALITGGAGFIGSHLAEALLERGDQVHVIDNLSTGRLENIEHLAGQKNFGYTIESIMNAGVMDELVKGCDRVYHLAAAVGVKLIMERPFETIETNVNGTDIVLKAANKHKKQTLITSTSEIYGSHVQHTLKEDDNRVLGPIKKWRWAYASSKTLDEFLAMAYFVEKKLPVVIVRLFNTVGPRQTAAYGMVIPSFVQNAILGKPIVVYGDGKQSRSFAYVKDVVGGMIGLMNHPKALGDVFNIGGEEEVTMNELAKRVKKLTKSPSEIAHLSYEEAYGKGFEDMERRMPDITKIKNLIDYKPSIKLDDIITKVIEDFKK